MNIINQIFIRILLYELLNIMEINHNLQQKQQS